jgi:small conductance mechanosensitive channel
MTVVKDGLKLLQDKFAGWLQKLITMTPNFVLAAILVIAFYYLAKKAQRLIRSILERLIDNRALVNFLGGLARVAIILMGVLVAIKILNLDEVVFSVLAGVGIAGLAIGFAFQDIAANFIAGIALVFRKDYPFKVGDIVATNDYMGVIKEISIRDTLLETFSGQIIFIPNKLIFENTVNNFSLSGRRRIDLAVGISYGDNLDKVRQVTIDAIKKIDQRIEDKQIAFHYDQFGDSSINFYVRFWIPFKRQADFLEAQSKAIMLIKQAYDANNITIPFPIRTLDFGIKGGQRLDQVWRKESR